MNHYEKSTGRSRQACFTKWANGWPSSSCVQMLISSAAAPISYPAISARNGFDRPLSDVQWQSTMHCRHVALQNRHDADLHRHASASDQVHRCVQFVSIQEEDRPRGIPNRADVRPRVIFPVMQMTDYLGCHCSRVAPSLQPVVSKTKRQ